MLEAIHINKLFDYLWPAMILASGHKATCIEKLPVINSCFTKFKDDHDKLLASLSSLDGIGLTIASGLIWSYYPHNRVPYHQGFCERSNRRNATQRIFNKSKIALRLTESATDSRLRSN